MALPDAPALPDDALLFEHAPCGLLLCDAGGVIVRANATLCGWLAYGSAALLGHKRLHDLLTVGGKVFHQTHCAPLLAIQGSVAEVQLEMLDSAGQRIPVLINILRRPHGGTHYDEIAVFIATDRRAYERELLSARKTAESSLEARLGAEARLREVNAQLSLAHRRKDEFLATLAHELRNPLAPMRNVLETVKRKPAGAVAEGWALEVLERQLNQLTHLVDDLMEVSRISQGRLELRRQPVDLALVLRAAVDDAAPMVEAAGHTLEVSLPAQTIMVDADATRLTQVVINLLTNAVKYTPEGGRIVLSVRRQGEQAMLTVQDSGIGIPRESLASVFEMFSQLTPALERSQGGLGIGLALVRGLVELHGGSIVASSAGLGQGSAFTVTLPALPQLPQAAFTAAEAAAPAASAAPPDAGGAPGGRVLVVDDNVDSADTLVMALEAFGYQVRSSYSAAGALQLAAEFQPRLVLLDIGLPGMNGYEVARRLRSAPGGAGLFLVAATGWGQDADRELARAAGFDRHLVKPIDFEHLQALLDACFGAPPGSG